ncbi:MAG: TetR/AcrR family transcriptional regulator [Bacteroidia bacterium]|nr:TetR/AcrR family transcriptional regulator [Bacteroidia bacterium]
MARNREFNTEKVLNKAIQLFWQNGYNGVSTQELISDFEISKSSMYGAFGDKMELYIAALENIALPFLATLSEGWKLAKM